MITRTQKAVLAALLAAGACGVAQAEGLYFGGSLGVPDYHSSINGIKGSGNGIGGKLYGGYQLTPNLGFEGGFFDLGHVDNANGHVNTRGVFADAVGRIEVLPQISLFGTAGVAQGRFRTSFGNDWSPALKLGVGAEYAISRTMALRLQYERYHFTDAFDTTGNVGQSTVGLKVNF